MPTLDPHELAEAAYDESGINPDLYGAHVPQVFMDGYIAGWNARSDSDVNNPLSVRLATLGRLARRVVQIATARGAVWDDDPAMHRLRALLYDTKDGA